jgi:SAM-dependent methyltransferase
MMPAFEVAAAGCTDALSRLSAIGYDESAVRERLGLSDLADLQMRALPIYRRERLHRGDALDRAIDLFLLQGELSEAALGSVLSPAARDALVHSGLLERRGDAVRARASLFPVGSRLVFSDLAWPQLLTADAYDAPHDLVMAVGADSRWLARATVRRPIASALDLCTGSGIHALLAAQHARSATAVDINPRAVRCTAFNAAAMGLAHVEALEGDLYAPVGGRTFDLITANPPFVPAPAQELGFRDGGPSGEDVQRRIVAGLPRHLARGGIAQVVTEVGERDGEALESRVREWLEGAPMDVHVLRLRVHSAQAYAIGHAGGDEHASFLDSVERWSANLAAQRYDRVVSVLLAFQWSEAPWSRADDAFPPLRDAGADIEAILAAESLSRDPALAGRLRAGSVMRTGAITVVGVRTLGSEEPAAARASLRGAALPVEHALGALELDLLEAMDGAVAVADFLAAAATAGVAESAVLDALGSLLRKGFARLEVSARR